MVEFTQREKIIVHAMNTMLNPTLKDVPFDLKTNALKATLLCAGYTWNETEMTDIMDGSVSLMGHNSLCFPSGHKRDVPKEQNTHVKGSVARTHYSYE